MEVNLVFIRKDRTTQSFPLPSAVTFIGRRQDCDMCIPLSVVSRRHCQIYTEFGKVMLRDLKSRNGTQLNGESIEETQVNAGDILTIGPVKFIIQIDGVPEHFDEFLPQTTKESQREISAPEQDETQEASFEESLDDQLIQNGGQSQTMDMDDIFGEDLLGDDEFDLDSDLP